MQDKGKCFQVYYSKDIHKKKKVYSEGLLVCQGKKTKLYNSEGECILSVNQKNDPEIDAEYTLSHAYFVLVDAEIEYQKFATGKAFIQAVPPPVLKVVKKPKSKYESKKQQEYDTTKRFENGLKIQKFILEKLRPHQIQGVNFMYECIMKQKGNNIEGCILADFMGLGKTLQTLTLIRSVTKMNILNKIVVVCPLTLVRVWQRQCQKWLKDKISPLVVLGVGQQVTKTVRMFVDYDYRFMILSYQSFLKHADSFNKKCDLLIFDEGHKLKNKRSKLFKKIQTFKCKKRILLTGTPLQNNLEQLYTCITLVNPSFFQSQLIFRNVFQKPILAGMAKNSTKQQQFLALMRTQQLAGRIKQFSLRRKADVLEQYLPKKRQFQIFFKLTPLQLIWYERCMKKKINEADVLSFINLMRKLFTHPQIFKNDRFDSNNCNQCFEDCREQPSHKMQFILSVAKKCQKSEEKLVIVSYFTETLDFVAKMLERQEIKYCQLDGRADGKDRHRIIDSFAKLNDVLLLSGKAGGTGLTLTCACKMIMIQPDWNPSNDSQVMGRVWRQGQQKEVEIYRLIIASSFEQKILQRQQLKQSLSENLIDDKSSHRSYDFFSLKKLFIDISQNCLTYKQKSNELDKCIKQIEQINWSSVIHVQIKHSHTDEVKKISNEFEEAVFLDNENQKEEQQLIDEDEESNVFQKQKVNDQPQKIKFTKKSILKQIKEQQKQIEQKQQTNTELIVKDQIKQDQDCEQTTEEIQRFNKGKISVEQVLKNTNHVSIALKKIKKQNLKFDNIE